MRKVIAAEFVSLDGYVAGPDGEMNWGPASIDPDDLKPEWDTILLGRVTYQLSGWNRGETWRFSGARTWYSPSSIWG